MVDIGAYSSRPGAEDVTKAEELRRLLPAIDIVREEWPEAIISVDTFRAEVARRAVEAGADIINDISGGEMDPDMFSAVAISVTSFFFIAVTDIYPTRSDAYHPHARM